MSGFSRLHALLVDDDTLAQVCRDLPESACREQPRNYGVHVVSLSLTKIGEGLADAKLVLAWLLDAIGTPAWSHSAASAGCWPRLSLDRSGKSVAQRRGHRRPGRGRLSTRPAAQGLASAAASLVSTYVWGRLADRSSRRVLMLAATLAALANAVAAFVALAVPNLLDAASLLPGLLFVLMIAHQGVRLGRSVHVVDMADRDSRATYTALSNSTVGLILLASGIFGVIAQWLGIGAVLAIFMLMASLAIRAAAGLDDVQAA